MEVDINVLGFESDGLGSLLDEWHFGCNKTTLMILMNPQVFIQTMNECYFGCNKTYTYVFDEYPNLHSNHVAR